MKSLKTVFTLLSVFLFSTILIAQDSTEVLLRMQFKEGDSIKIRRSETTEITFEVLGMEQNTTEVDIFDYLFEISDVQKDTAKIKMTFTDLYQKEEGPEGVWEFDSKEKDMPLDDLKTRMLYKMIGFSMNMGMNDLGIIQSFTGADRLLNLIVDDPELGLSGFYKEQLKSSMASLINDDVFRQAFGQYFLYINEKPVKVGDSWKVQAEVKQFALVSNYNFTYVKKVGNEVILQVKGNLGSAEDGGYIDYGTMQIKYDMTGPISGFIKVDATTGWLIEENIRMEMSGKMEVKEVGDEEPVSTDMSLKITTSFKQVDE